jgi:hypothetical protein|nr:MAG TPA_asm: hypothetical protein [Caudoviricetes sp.]
MTNITELAQREKFEAWFVNDVVGADVNFPAFKDGEYTEGEIYDEQLYFMLQAMWMAWKAAGAELVEALEKAQAINAAAEKLVRCKGRYHSEQNYRALAALFGVTTPDLPPLDGEPVGEVIEVGDALLVGWHKNLEEGAKLYTTPQAPVVPEDFDFNRFNDVVWLECVASNPHMHSPTTSAIALVALELNKRSATMEAEPDRNPVLAYADSYRDMAKQGVESVPIWSVITDLERNIAPLYRHAHTAPVVRCPFHCGWDNLNKLAIQDAALVARGLVEGELTTEAHRQAAISNNDRLLKVISACRAAMLNGGKS